jgi:phosphoserine phosphatase RsbU/P
VDPNEIIYEVDRDLRITGVNAAFKAFAAANNGLAILSNWRDKSLLENFSGRERLRWQAIYQQLLSGGLPFHVENIMCPSPSQRRNLHCRIVPQFDDQGAVRSLVHTLHVALMPPEPQERSEPDLECMATIAAYRRQIAARKMSAQRFFTESFLEPLEKVGGDLLWSHEWSDGCVDVVIADAMGHGVEAARLAIQLAALLDELCKTREDLSIVVGKLNFELVRSRRELALAAPRAMFATGLYVRLDPLCQTASFCCFGHSGPIFSNAGLVELKGGPPVGILDGPSEANTWPVVSLSFAVHGDRFLIFTDGIIEQFNEAGEMFGYEGLKRVFAETLNLSVSAAVERIVASIKAFRNNAFVKDDQAMLCVQTSAA